jgi:hypothetical protein
VCGDDTCQDEYHSSSTTPFSNPLPSPISSPPTSTHTPTPAPSPTSTLLINDTGVITDEVHLLGTHCCANSSTLHFCGLKESALQSAEIDLRKKRLLIGCGGAVTILDLINPDAATTIQTPKRALLAPFSILDLPLTDLSHTEGEREITQ